MAQLLVRDVEENLVRKLKQRASSHGVSAEEEHRRILREALTRPLKGKPSLIEFLLTDEGAVQTDIDLDLDRSRVPESRDPGF